MNKHHLYVAMLLFVVACSPPAGESSKMPENKVDARGALISPPECPDWSASATVDVRNGRAANMGCATVTNLGLMLENPRDLEQGASGGKVVPDPERSVNAVRRYRAGSSGTTGATATGKVE